MSESIRFKTEKLTTGIVQPCKILNPKIQKNTALANSNFYFFIRTETPPCCVNEPNTEKSQGDKSGLSDFQLHTTKQILNSTGYMELRIQRSDTTSEVSGIIIQFFVYRDCRCCNCVFRVLNFYYFSQRKKFRSKE